MNVDFQVYDNDTLVGNISIYSDKYFEFAYDISWLKSDEAFAIDVNLPLENRTFSATTLWGCFADICPDRWGKLLQKRFAGHALSEPEYMLGVSDYFRIGSIRLKDGDKFIAQTNNMPRLIHLNQLAQSSLNIENDEYTEKDLKDLLSPGSSLGGAHPKSSVVDGNKLYIAKFSSKKNDYSAILWEKTLLDLANIAGINTAKAKLISTFDDKQILLVERFDRTNDGKRIPFMSAMSLLEAQEHNDDSSYVELAMNLNHIVDKQELFKRMVFNMLFGNTDDHLRNHALLYDRTAKQWHLSPAYDLNPSDMEYLKQGHALNFVDFNNLPNLKLCNDLKEYFAVNKELYKQIVEDCLKAAEKFEEIAKKNGIKAQNIEYMKKCSYFYEVMQEHKINIRKQR